MDARPTYDRFMKYNQFIMCPLVFYWKLKHLKFPCGNCKLRILFSPCFVFLSMLRSNGRRYVREQ